MKFHPSAAKADCDKMQSLCSAKALLHPKPYSTQKALRPPKKLLHPKNLLRHAVRAVELCCNLQMRSCKPDPLAADIVHVRKDRRNGAGRSVAGRAGRFGSPGGRVKMFDKNLVHAIIGGKDLDCGSAELSVDLALTRGHGSFGNFRFRPVVLPLLLHAFAPLS